MRITVLALAMAVFAAGFALADDQAIDLARFESRDGSTSFLHQEAGMSAYAQLTGTIDLAKAKSAMRTVEKETSEYVIGSVALTGYDDSHDVHVYVDKAGWIIAYYPASEKASKIINWISYADSGSFLDTKVRVALSKVCEQMLQFPSTIKYYDFRYPDATKMMIVADQELSTDVTETFRIKIPSGIPVYSRTWSFYSTGSTVYTSNMKMDGVVLISSKAATIISEGDLTISQLSPDQYHEVSLFNDNNRKTYGAIMLLYRE
ncbi:MAG: hypothetical protein AB7S75_13640 [Desulfococcaceae bacterium]